MRYWIYWNDLVQGPFEIEELLTLKAFRADLLVCEEGREDWTPAAAFSELAQHFATVAPPTGSLPPPPPSQPPSLSPLQGEFFNESPDQQPLFDLNGSKNYAYRPAEDAPAPLTDESVPPVTMPFRFAVILPPWLEPPVEKAPPTTLPSPEPAIHHEEHERGPLEPETLEEPKTESYPVVEKHPLRTEIQPAWTEEPLPIVAEDRVETPVLPSPIETIHVTHPILEPPVIETTVIITPVIEPPVIETPPVVIPPIEKPPIVTPPPSLKPISTTSPIEKPPIITPPPSLKPISTPQPLEVPPPATQISKPVSPPIVKKPTPLLPEFPERRAPPVRIERAPTPLPYEVPTPETKTRLWPWLLAAFASLGVVGGALLLWMLHSPSSPPATTEPTTIPVAPGAPTLLPSPVPPLQNKISKPELNEPIMASVKAGIWKIVDFAGTGNGPFVTPAGVAVNSHGTVYVAERTTSKIYMYDSGSQQWTVIGQSGQKAGEFSSPTGVAVSPSGQVWVADQGNNRLQVYSPATHAWVVIGESGKKTGEFNSPTGVAVSPNGQVWVADQGNHRLQIYDLATNQWTSVGQKGQAAGHFKFPSGVAVDAKGRVWVADTGNNRVQRYDPVTQRWSVVGKQGTTRGSFSAPAGVAVATTGEVWVADTANNRIQTYNPNTQHWKVVGRSGQAAGEFNAPTGVAVSPGGDVWVADEGNNRLQLTKIGSLAAAVPSIVGAHSGTPKKSKISAATKTSSVTAPIPVAAVPSEKPTAEAILPNPPPTNVAPPPADPWRGREQEAISIALQQKLYGGQRTVGTNAKLMLEDMHEKELLHAADTGERLYMPDKIAWSALHETGPRYRVYLNFMAWQASGERTQARSDQFLVDIDKKTVVPADDGTHHDFFDDAAKLHHQHSPKADDIESVLSAVDVLNRQKLRAVILKSDKDDKKSVQNGLQVADGKLQRMLVYFRTKYAELTLQNVAKAYMFSGLVKSK